MKFQWLLIVACLLVTACDNKPKVATSSSNSPTAAERFEVVNDRYEDAQKKFQEAYRAANSVEEKNAAVEGFYPKPDSYADEFLGIAKDFPDDPIAFKALSWIATNVRQGEKYEFAINELLSNHIDNEAMKQHCMMMMYGMPSENTMNNLNRLINESPHESVKGAATYSLATYLGNLAATQKHLKDNPEQSYHDEKANDYIAGVTVDKAEIKELYRTVIDKFGDMKMRPESKRTLGQLAESALFEMSYLLVGQIAPDIEGADLDDVSFKLSDYRGKVVVIDFWGDW